MILFGSSALVWARDAAPLAADPVLEERMMAIASELRCLVCQNQTIADSQADLAVDLREQIRVQLRRGESPEQIRDFMVHRYGDFVLYRPPLRRSTLLLWIGPFALLLIAALGMAYAIKQRSRGGRFQESIMTNQSDERGVPDSEIMQTQRRLRGKRSRR